MKYIIGFLFFVFSFNFAYAQELDCQVSVSGQQIGLSDKSVFQTLQKAVYEFMNNRQWSNVKLTNDERIECSIFINLDSKSGDVYSGSIQVQSRRPVFNTSYNSVLLNHKDNDLKFEYVEHDPLIFQLNSYEDNLTSILAFYAYYIIGLDFDTYSLKGGTPFFENAQTVLNAAQNSGEAGWAAFDSQKSRYWLIENTMNSAYDDYRQFMYDYHRKGLDVMYEKLPKGRLEALAALELLQKVYRTEPGLFVLQVLMDAKRDEFIGMFSEAPPMEQSKAKNILVELDPAKSSEYEKITQQK